MSDPRLNSCHLLFPRRLEYRRCREALLGERGWLTLAAEQFNDLVRHDDQWPVRPDQALPGTRYLLVDRQSGGAYRLETGLNTVGRFSDNDIVFEDRYISRRHCVILIHAWGGCELHDTASLNGTFVNGARVRGPVRLASGDRIRLCDRDLVFVSEQDALDGQDEDHSGTAVHFPPLT
jgi:hypothetical protein